MTDRLNKKPLELDAEAVEAAVLGGCVLGGGGGGAMALGREVGHLAVQGGALQLVEIEDVPPDALLITCSLVGAPSARDTFVGPQDYVRAVEILSRSTGLTIAGLISSECGGLASVNGWYQAARLGVPLVDAPCNGRAHPLGVMGSMGLHTVAGYVSFQAVAGGKEEAGRHVEAFFRGGLEAVSSLVRRTAVEAGGMVAVARNPVEARYVRDHGAPGALSCCIELGRAMLAVRTRGGREVVAAAAKRLGGEVAVEGRVSDLRLTCADGFDVGRMLVSGREITFLNEYITMEHEGRRVATFPDLIMTFDASDGRPVPSAEIEEGQDVAILIAPRGRLILGAGMRDPSLFAPLEKALGKALAFCL